MSGTTDINPLIFFFVLDPYLDVKDLGRAAQVSKDFNKAINSGCFQGKTTRAYLLGKVQKIDFTFTQKDIVESVITALKLPKFEKYDIQTQFHQDIFNVLAPYFEKITAEQLEGFKQKVLNNIRQFIFQDEQVSNISLARFVKNPNSLTSQELIKDLAIRTLAKMSGHALQLPKEFNFPIEVINTIGMIHYFYELQNPQPTSGQAPQESSSSSISSQAPQESSGSSILSSVASIFNPYNM